jgi:SAM-dependent methyltransferase
MRRKVKANDGIVPVEDILCTTYQMRDFYSQFRDGFFTNLDVMNLIQHLAVVKMIRPGDTVVDLCCGRGMLLPLMRYYARHTGQYVGVDVERRNMTWWEKEYPFPTRALVLDVADCAREVGEGAADLVVYTSSIEHMHKEHGERSLREAARILKVGGLMFLSCPNTPEDKSGYEVQYRAHVYEWKLSELRDALGREGFRVEREYGLVGNLRDLKPVLEGAPRAIRQFFDPVLEYLPREFSTAMLFVAFPSLAKEVALLCRRIA